MRACPAALLMALLWSCAPLAKVSVRDIKEIRSPFSGTGAPVIERMLSPAGGPRGGEDGTRPALTGWVEAAEKAMEELKENPSNAGAMQRYDFAVARMFTLLRKADVFPAGGLRLGGDRLLVWEPDPRKMWNPADYDFYPVDELELEGDVFQKPVRRAGLGSPLVAVRKEPLKDFRKIYLGSPNVYYGVTAVLRFQGRRCVLSLEDPLATETVRAAGRTFPLAADFTTALAMVVERNRPEKLGLSRLLRPGKYDNTTMLFRMQPFDPDRIPVIFVHGLDSTPATWLPMFTHLLGDEKIRRKYQFWFFSYPSGYPFAYSAALLRRELDGIRKVYPHKPVVMVGHSMGGLLSRLMITRSGNQIWQSVFSTPPSATRLPEKTRELLEETLIFEPRPEISRVIFCSTPHRGSDIAAGWLGRLGSRLVRLPDNLVEAGSSIFSGNVLNQNMHHLRKVPNSVDTLSNKGQFVQAMNKLPFHPGIPWHQIIGDRGKGDSPDSSDGFVPYWSSFVEGATSTRIVPSGHSSHANPEAIAEVGRILHEHLRKNPQ